MKIKAFISDGTWFDKDSLCLRVANCNDPTIIGVGYGIYVGIRTVENPDSEGGCPIGYKHLDEESCSDDEFTEIEIEIDDKDIINARP